MHIDTGPGTHHSYIKSQDIVVMQVSEAVSVPVRISFVFGYIASHNIRNLNNICTHNFSRCICDCLRECYAFMHVTLHNWKQQRTGIKYLKLYSDVVDEIIP